MAHASSILNYPLSVNETILKDRNTFVKIYSHLLKQEKLLAKCEKAYSAADRPWMFLAYGAQLLAKEGKKPFFLVDMNVSVYFH